MDLQQTTIHLPPFLHGEVRRQAALRNISMSQLARLAFVNYLQLGPGEMVEAMSRLEGGGSRDEWAELPGFAVAGLADAYRLLDGLVELHLSSPKRTEITFEWMQAPINSREDWRDSATLFAAATLADPELANELIVQHIAQEMEEGVSKPNPRVAGLLERTASPPLDQLVTLSGQGARSDVLAVQYATHVSGRNLVEEHRAQLLDLVHSFMTTSADRAAVLAALELAAALRAGELVDAISELTLEGGDVQRKALVALGAVSAAQPAMAPEVDEQFSTGRGSSYYRIPIDRHLPVPTWQQWSVSDDQREYALGLLIERLDSGQLDARSAALAIGGVARSDHPEAQHYLVELGHSTELSRRPVPVEPLIAALASFETPRATEALERLSKTENAAARKAALKALYSTKPSADAPLGAGEPTLFATHASVLRWAAMSEVSWPLHEVELNSVVAPLCADYATVRRWMIGMDLFSRKDGMYQPMALGDLVTRVEQWLEANGVRGAKRKELLR